MKKLQLGNLPVALALSGELPDRHIVDEFDEIGLIRGEYIFRDAEQYPTNPGAANKLESYLRSICSRTSSKVRYRSMEVTEVEASVLEGSENYGDLSARDDLLGLRGVRRHMKYPSGFVAELEVLARVFHDHENLELVVPYVTQASEFNWYRQMVDEAIGRDCVVGTMIETPAAAIDIEDFTEAGCRNFIVGCNDLTSLLSAQDRIPSTREGVLPGFKRLVQHCVTVAHSNGGEIGVAGYLTKSIVETCRELQVDRFIIHYSDVPRFFDFVEDELPGLEHLKSVKAKTRDSIARTRSRSRVEA